MQMSDREKAGLRGAVAVCETERQWFPLQFEGRCYVARELFHVDGRRSETTREDQNGVTSTHRWLYYDDNRLREETYDGTLGFRRVFNYDAERRLSRVVRYETNRTHVEESYLYHDATSTQICYPQFPEGEFSVSVSSMLHMSADAVRIVTLRDRRGNPLEKVLYNVDDRPIHRVLFVYDDSGRLVEEGEAYSDNRIRDDFRNLYRYDAHGRCIEKEMHCPFAGERYTTTYNEYGDVSETRRMSLATEIDLFLQRSWATHFSYEYDAYRNWVTCNMESRALDTGEITHRERQHRRLEYWDRV